MPNIINVSDFDLAATLECGQAFRWQRAADGWFEGVVGGHVLRLRQIRRSGLHPRSLPAETEPVAPTYSRGSHDVLEWETFPPITNHQSPVTIRRYLSLDRSLADIAATFPADDEHLRDAVRKHWGLRVLRQEPWETLASFIASSTKQIVQIRQIVDLLARRFGEPIGDSFHAFPAIAVVARASHRQLWDCKLGFRAKNLLAAARMIDSGEIDWPGIAARAAGTLLPQPRCDYETARAELLKLPGVGEKIANCVLLFSCGFDRAFPIDVWIERALKRVYFCASPDGTSGRPARPVPGRIAIGNRSYETVSKYQLGDFARSHFGPCAGWAQQYLFFNERSAGQGQQFSNRR